MRSCAILIGILVSSSSLWSQTTRPASTPEPARQMLDSMLNRNSSSGARPLQPTSQPGIDVTTGSFAVAPGATTQPVLREGTYMLDRTGRMTRTGDGQQWEFNFESDGRTMKDPPLIILPNLKLMVMESILKSSNRDLKWRVTGMVTEYNGRNYILIDKATNPPDSTQQF
jgi:hypothetical protein